MKTPGTKRLMHSFACCLVFALLPSPTAALFDIAGMIEDISGGVADSIDAVSGAVQGSIEAGIDASTNPAISNAAASDDGSRVCTTDKCRDSGNDCCAHADWSEPKVCAHGWEVVITGGCYSKKDATYKCCEPPAAAVAEQGADPSQARKGWAVWGQVSLVIFLLSIVVGIVIYSRNRPAAAATATLAVGLENPVYGDVAITVPAPDHFDQTRVLPVAPVPAASFPVAPAPTPAPTTVPQVPAATAEFKKAPAPAKAAELKKKCKNVWMKVLSVADKMENSPPAASRKASAPTSTPSHVAETPVPAPPTTPAPSPSLDDANPFAVVVLQVAVADADRHTALFAAANPDASGCVTAQVAGVLLTKSGLKQEELRTVWVAAKAEGPGVCHKSKMDLKEFIIAARKAEALGGTFA